MSEVTDDFLEHYGVQGMKWGKRSGGSKPSGKSVRGARKEIRKEIYKDARASIKANKGKNLVSAILVGPSVTVGFNVAKAAGYSNGKAAVIAAVSGTPGAMIAANIAARKAVANGDD